MNRGEIILYQTPDGTINLDVRLENETIWLTQAQMVTLFDSSKANVSEHIKQIFKTHELEEDATVRKFRTVRIEGKREVSRELEYYNLDMIIAVGYRVNTIRGTQFRIWANRILKDYIVKGYAINQRAKVEQLEDLKQTIKLLSNVIQSKKLTADESQGLLQVITDYTYAFSFVGVRILLKLLQVITDYTYALDTLDRYDYQSLEIDEESFVQRWKQTDCRFSFPVVFGEKRYFVQGKRLPVDRK